MLSQVISSTWRPMMACSTPMGWVLLLRIGQGAGNIDLMLRPSAGMKWFKVSEDLNESLMSYPALDLADEGCYEICGVARYDEP